MDGSLPLDPKSDRWHSHIHFVAEKLDARGLGSQRLPLQQRHKSGIMLLGCSLEGELLAQLEGLGA